MYSWRLYKLKAEESARKIIHREANSPTSRVTTTGEFLRLILIGTQRFLYNKWNSLSLSLGNVMAIKQNSLFRTLARCWRNFRSVRNSVPLRWYTLQTNSVYRFKIDKKLTRFRNITKKWISEDFPIQCENKLFVKDIIVRHQKHSNDNMAVSTTV